MYENKSHFTPILFFTYLLNNINCVKKCVFLSIVIWPQTPPVIVISLQNVLKWIFFESIFIHQRNCFLLRICSWTWNVILPIFTLNVWQKFKIMQKTLHQINAYGIAEKLQIDILSKISSKLITNLNLVKIRKYTTGQMHELVDNRIISYVLSITGVWHKMQRNPEHTSRC